MIREIRTYPDPVLHRIAKAVEKVDDEVRQLLDDLQETMQANSGVGIAAPQIGVSRRVAIVDVDKPREADSPDYENMGKYELINPEILDQDGELEWEEGCLSVPGFWLYIKRSHRLTLRYLDRDGQKKVLKAEGLLAVAIQQELDHLDGKLIIDNVSRLKQTLYLHKLRKAKKKKQRGIEEE